MKGHGSKAHKTWHWCLQTYSYKNLWKTSNIASTRSRVQKQFLSYPHFSAIQDVFGYIGLQITIHISKRKEKKCYPFSNKYGIDIWNWEVYGQRPRFRHHISSPVLDRIFCDSYSPSLPYMYICTNTINLTQAHIHINIHTHMNENTYAFRHRLLSHTYRNCSIWWNQRCYYYVRYRV